MNDDLISRQEAINAFLPLYQEHRYKIPGKIETYSQYNEAWQDALSRAENVIFYLPSAQPELIRCQDCKFGLGHAHNVKCDKYYGMGGYDDFCSRAERKEDATD